MTGFTRPTDDLTIGDYLDHHAARFPERQALRSARRDLTYGQLAREVDSLAQAMHRLGLQVGDRIAVLAPPRVEAFITFLAAARLGLIWLGLNPKYKLPELEYVIEDSQPAMIFGVDEAEGRSYEMELSALRKPYVKKFVGFDRGAHFDLTYENFLGESAGVEPGGYEARKRELDATLPAMLVYTSGSSGRPKGVLLGHRSLLQRSRNQLGQFPASPYPSIVNPFPINHIGGMHLVAFYAFIGEGTLHYTERFDPDAIIDLLEDREINSMITVPTMLHLITTSARFRPELLDNLQWFYFSGAAMPKDLMELLFRSKAGIGLTYGMTETSGGVTYCKADRQRYNLEEMTSSIGRPVPDGEVRILKANGTKCAAGESGEIQVRADFCMSGYFRRDDETRSAFTADGWMKTGDLATIRADGNIEFAGRLSEMFKSGGYNVYPREVEMALETHPEVAVAAVVARKDAVFGEVGYAYVIPKPGSMLHPDQLAEWARARLANYKVPKMFLVSRELPLLPVGKIDKVTLRQLASSEHPAPAEVA